MMSEAQKERLYRPEEVAELFNKHERTIRRWINQGHFPKARLTGPHIKSGYVIPESDVIAMGKKLGHIED